MRHMFAITMRPGNFQNYPLSSKALNTLRNCSLWPSFEQTCKKNMLGSLLSFRVSYKASNLSALPISSSRRQSNISSSSTKSPIYPQFFFAYKWSSKTSLQFFKQSRTYPSLSRRTNVRFCSLYYSEGKLTFIRMPRPILLRFSEIIRRHQAFVERWLFSARLHNKINHQSEQNHNEKLTIAVCQAFHEVQLSQEYIVYYLMIEKLFDEEDAIVLTLLNDLRKVV